MLALQQVLEKKIHIPPKLEKLTLEGEFVKHADRLDGVRELVQTAKAKGVEIVILTCENRNSWSYGKRSERGWGLDESVQWRECIHNRVGQMEMLHVDEFGW